MNASQGQILCRNEAQEFFVCEFQTFEDIRSHWLELNRSYKANELALDWEANKLIWDSFYKKRKAGLKFTAGFQKGRCVGIFPLFWIEKDPTEPPGWYLSDDFIISREYFCYPDKIHLFADHLSPHSSDDLSCFYTPLVSDRFSLAPGGVVELKQSQDEYLQSLKKKSRHTFRRTLDMNSDLTVQVDCQIRWREIRTVLKSQIDNWMKKAESVSVDYFFYSRDKIRTDLLLMSRAQAMGKLIALYFYCGRNLIAANFAVRRENDRIDDYICLRDCREEYARRGLGIFAILKNMEVCRNLGIRYYDLSACLKDYKRKFINVDSFFYFLPRTGEDAGRPLPARTGIEPSEAAVGDHPFHG